MKIYIDTTEKNRLVIEKGSVSNHYSNNKMTDQFLVLISNSIDNKKNDILKVEVNTGPGGYTSTRIGVAIANVINNLFLENNKIFLPKYKRHDMGY